MHKETWSFWNLCWSYVSFQYDNPTMGFATIQILFKYHCGVIFSECLFILQVCEISFFFLPISHHPGVDRIFCNSALKKKQVQFLLLKFAQTFHSRYSMSPPGSRSRATIFAPSELPVGTAGWNSSWNSMQTSLPGWHETCLVRFGEFQPTLFTFIICHNCKTGKVDTFKLPGVDSSCLKIFVEWTS